MGIDDVVWIIVFALLGAVAARISLRLFGTIITPLGIYVLGNCTAGILYHLRLLAYPDVSIQVHALVILSMLCFGGAAVLVSRRPVGSDAVRDDRGLESFFRVTFAIALVGWGLPLALMLMKYGAGHLLTNLWLLESEFQMQYIGHLNVINILIFPTYIVKRHRLGVGKLDALFLALSFFGLFLSGIKSFLIYSIVAGMLAQSVSAPRGIRPGHLAGFVILIVGFFVMYDRLIDLVGAVGLPGSSFPESLRFLERPYYYATGAWPAMDVVVQGQVDPVPVPGFVTFQAFWKVVADFFGVVDPIPRALPFVPVGPYFFNVFSFTGEVYFDWGLPGLVLMSAAVGGIVTRLYLSARRAAFWGGDLLYAIVGYGVVISFFVCFFLRFTMLSLFLYMIVLGYLPVGLLSRLRRGADGS